MKKYQQAARYYKYGRDDYGRHGYNPETESYAFAVPHADGFKRSSTWYGCRENLDSHFDKRRKALMLYNQRGDRVAAFMEQVEKRLNVKPRTLIQGFENTKNVCVIQFSPWWMENGARRQLLTILLRCGMNYKRSFWEAVWSNEYMVDTEQAVKKFFQGFTNFKSRGLRGGAGWVEYFDEENYDGDLDEKLEKLQ